MIQLHTCRIAGRGTAMYAPFQAFAKLDEDHDGVLSFAEASPLLSKAIGSSLTEDQLGDICRLADIDQDGRLTREEVRNCSSYMLCPRLYCDVTIYRRRGSRFRTYFAYSEYVGALRSMKVTPKFTQRSSEARYFAMESSPHLESAVRDGYCWQISCRGRIIPD